MFAFKPFLSQDVIVFPFEANKLYAYSGSNLTSSIDIFFGENIDGLLYPYTGYQTGYITTQYKNLVYKSIKHLYYSNFISSSYGDNIYRKELIPGYDETGDIWIGNYKNSSYVDYFPTSLTYPKYFPTGSGDKLLVLSIPKRLYGDFIKPGSLRFTSSPSTNYLDDGEGNLIDVSNTIYGNVFYSHGLVVLYREITPVNEFELNFNELYDNGILNLSDPDSLLIEVNGNVSTTLIVNITMMSSASAINEVEPPPYPDPDGYINWSATTMLTALENNLDPSWTVEYIPSSSILPQYGIYSGSYRFRTTNIYSTSSVILDNSSIFTISSWGQQTWNAYYNILNNSIDSSSFNLNNVTCSFSSSYQINQTQYRCFIAENEFNFSLNPSLQNSGSLRDFVTGSDFKPYITTVGLYNDDLELLAIGKLSQPLPISNTVDTNIIINIDR